MFCRHCGMKVMVGVSTCPACGRLINNDNEQENGTKIYDPRNLNTNMATHKQENNKSYSDNKNKNLGIFIVLGILIVLLIIATIKFLNNF